jgi:O-antigen/teichoic acid export membrane protein
VIAGRALGPADYGSVLALVSVLTILAVPGAAMQTLTAAQVSRAALRSASTAAAEVDALTRLGELLALGVTALLLLAALPLARVFAIDSVSVVALTGLAAGVGVLLATARGVTQGHRQFGRLSAALVAEPALRLVALVTSLVAGLRVGAPILAFLVGYAGIYVVLRTTQSRKAAEPGTRHMWRRLREIIPYSCAVTIAAALYNADVLVARVALSPDGAGTYSAGAVLGRAVFFLGGAASMALLPLVASAETARARRRYLLEALVLTAGAAGVPAAAYALAPQLAIMATFGSAYMPLQDDLWRFGASMLLYALANLALSYLIAVRRWQVIAPLLAVQLTQIATLAAFHQDVRSIANTQIAVMALMNLLIWPMVIAALRAPISDRAPVQSS